MRAALFYEKKADGAEGGGGGGGGGGATPLDDRAFDCVTLSGYLCAVHGEIPATGAAIHDSGFRFTVVDSDDRRVREVLAEPAATPAADGGAGDDVVDDEADPDAAGAS